MCLLGGLGGFLGSIAGAAVGGKTALFVGGFVGGIAIAPFSARLALWRHWIGFVAAALVAINTLSSPIGPVLSTLLTGVGAFVGRRMSK